MGAADLGFGASGPAEPEAPVGPAVTANLVISRRDPAHGLGRLRRALTDQEEGGANLAPGQELEDPLAPDRIRAVVEGERDAAVRGRAAPDAAGRDQVCAPRVRGPGCGRPDREPPENHRAGTRRSSTVLTIRRVARSFLQSPQLV